MAHQLGPLVRPSVRDAELPRQPLPTCAQTTKPSHQPDSLYQTVHPATSRSGSRPSTVIPLPLLTQLWARLLVAALPPVLLLTLL